MSTELSYINKFHGHIGPYVVLGYRMGIYALELLKCDQYWDMNVTAEMGIKPPPSCLIDGLQLSTGCTLGKGNISKLEVLNNRAHFSFENQMCTIILREEIVQEIKDSEDIESLAKEYYKKPQQELFIVKLGLKE